ncbi:biotin-dependent carboxyltransferase family protein [Bacillus pumilus]|uniref:KipI antagonist n=1 Tax=Bacillus pumilus TaxID=1408 RepID=A0AAD0HKG5_BACPU|nr:biotin-dependent carboxyltransferase family protein [Bacillus pumilus]AVM22729.1 KipI antagonist [Bacillus pumilus]TYS32279.1 biotin-dependent carboxyltransferase family protein [Bacillus pumilus]TYS41396.1 biotin-dependent carboxyltransferase family protein [Bacillus pumilus]TYS48337.1 biotin-dependent carboxyltransferase family protein [Bacillus pumilus]
MSIHVIKPGMFTTIQDKGRKGYQKYGVLTSGGMDLLSLRMSNILTGNEESEAVLEITLMGPGPVLTCQRDELIAVTGADVEIDIDGEPAPLWKPLFVRSGSTITFGPCKRGCRAYLAVAGGFDVEPVMQSKSTYVRAGIGGRNGRPLEKGDVLSNGKPSIVADRLCHRLKKSNVKQAAFSAPDWTVSHAHFLPLRKSPVIRVLAGRHLSFFQETSQTAFFEQPYQVTPQSDRMGCRLKGEPVHLKEKLELISEAVAFGSIQIPPNGQPIILLADRQTTGGYPRIGEVATVDLPLIAQAMPGANLYFKQIDHQAAEQALFKQEAELRELAARIKLEAFV